MGVLATCTHKDINEIILMSTDDQNRPMGLESRKNQNVDKGSEKSSSENKMNSL